MKFKSILCFLTAVLTLGAAVSVRAAPGKIDCVVSNASYVSSYSPSTPGFTSSQVSFNVTCTRNSQGTSVQAKYSVTPNDGTNPTGTQNKAKNPNNALLNYDFYTDATCLTAWSGTGNVLSQSIPASQSVVDTYSFYACIPAGQTATGSSTLYSDIVTLTITPTPAGGGDPLGTTSNSSDYNSGTNGQVSVGITAPATCTISTAPSTVDFSTYTALGAAKTAFTSFAAICSNTLSYTMSLDNVDGVVAGLNYHLGFDTASGTAGTATLTRIGNGGAQTSFINGSMAGGQAGSCASGGCVGTKTDTRTLTLTF